MSEEKLTPKDKAVLGLFIVCFASVMAYWIIYFVPPDIEEFAALERGEKITKEFEEGKLK